MSDLEKIQEIKTIKNKTEKIWASSEKLKFKTYEIQRELNIVFEHLNTIKNSDELISNNTAYNMENSNGSQIELG